MEKLKRINPHMWLRRTKHWLRQRVQNLTGAQRATSAVLAVVVLFSVLIPLVQHVVEMRRYSLDAAALSLVGSVNQNLAAKLSYNSEKAAWEFNKPSSASSQQDDIATATALLKAQAGGSGADDETLYTATFPRDSKQGVTFADSQTNLSFTMTPNFQLYDGHSTDGRIIYPLSNGAKLVYTAKNNGMKEDIVLPRFIENQLSFDYTLNLPSTLEAKLLDDGSVGIFSADPILFSNIGTANNDDAEKLKSAQEQGEKNHLLFAIPSPVIKQTGEGDVTATAKFVLSGNKLSVVTDNMKTLHYPATVDPSIVVTSTSDFASGNIDDNISYDTDQISRGQITGGAVTGGWSSTGSGSFTARGTGGSAVYNGYLYFIGGAGPSSEVNYAPINSNGTVGSWGSTTSLPTNRLYGAAVPYNGRMYVYGGYTSGTTALDSVIYATINSDGTLGSWTSASHNMATATCRFGWTGYNGYLYAVGGAYGTVASNCGDSSTTLLNSLQYAPILANGDIGAWSTSSNTFTNARKDPGMAIYNGYAYLTSGTTDGITTYRDTQFAKLAGNGDIDAWQTSSQQLPSSGKYRFGYSAYNGYLYLLGGTNNMTGTLYAPLFSNGDIGAWASSSTMSTGRYGAGFAVYDGYAYYFGGNDTTSWLNDTGYAKIDNSGIASTSTSTTAFGTGVDAATGCAGFMYNGYLYCIGGYTGSAYSAQSRYAAINSDGTVGTWATTSALQVPVTGGSGVGSAAYAVYNNRVYLIGGTTLVSAVATNVSSVQYASFNTDGTLSSWTFTTSYPNVIANQAADAYNGYVYVRGYSGGGGSNRIYSAPVNNDGTLGSWTWINASNLLPTSVAFCPLVAYAGYLYSVGGYDNSNRITDVNYAKINSDGSLGTWTSTSSMSTPRSRFGVVVLNGYMYSYGGETASSVYTSTVEYAKINSDGSLGTWQTSTSLAVTAADFGYASWNDTLYTIAGRNNGTRGKTVLYLKARSGGGGVNGSWTVSGNTFTTGRTNHESVMYNGYLYILGGIDSGGSRLSDVQYAKLNDDGTVGSWSSTTSFSTARESPAAFTYRGYMFICGGKTGTSTFTDTCYSAPINSDGSVGSWSSTATLPNQIGAMATVAYDGYVYILGGMKTSALNTVYVAPLNSDGTVGSWSSTTSFTNARSNLGAVANNGYIYVLGGINGSTLYSDVQYAPINSNGTVGSWSYTTNMSYGRAYTSPTVFNGNLYIYGGYDGTTAYKNVLYAPFLANGAIGSWTSGTAHTNIRYGHQVVMYNGYMYLTGGYGNSTYYDNVQYSAIQSSPRVGTYSKVFDLGALYSLSGISYGGTIPGGSDAISYRTAGEDGVFGSSALASSISSGASTCQVGSVRYVLVTTSLDDSGNATFSDEASTPAHATSLSVSYTASHAATEKRLAHGKYFNDETQQPLDTCSE